VFCWTLAQIQLLTKVLPHQCIQLAMDAMVHLIGRLSCRRKAGGCLLDCQIELPAELLPAQPLAILPSDVAAGRIDEQNCSFACAIPAQLCPLLPQCLTENDVQVPQEKLTVVHMRLL
jgi:hypothetical protein